jgi:hypothetical protein
MLNPSTSVHRREARTAGARGAWHRLRVILLAAGFLSMAVGLYSGLIRLGIQLPRHGQPFVVLHGAFMICGFLGTVICLERAVAYDRAWVYAAPLLSAIGTVALLAGAPRFGAVAFGIAGGIAFVASAALSIRQFALFTVALTIGAACWVVGTLQWLIGDFSPAVTGWWLNFLVLTVAAERLELSRIRDPSRFGQITFAGVMLLLLFGSARGELTQSSAPFTAAGLLGCAAWLLHYDIARRTVRLSGQPRFSAVAILVGHAWLGVAAVILAMAPPGTRAFSYDAVVHAIAIGFALSMILGHAPIILPAVIGIRVRFRLVAYIPLVLLHLSLGLRIIGDFLERGDLRESGALITLFALILYGAILALSSTTRAPRSAA